MVAVSWSSLERRCATCRPATCASAIDAELADATAVLDAFHVGKLGIQVVDEVHRRLQQGTTWHHGRMGDALFGIQTIVRAGAETLTDRQLARLERAITAHDAHEEVYVAWRGAQDLQAAFRVNHTDSGRARAEKILDSFHTRPIPEFARLEQLGDEPACALRHGLSFQEHVANIHGVTYSHRKFSANLPMDSPGQEGDDSPGLSCRHLANALPFDEKQLAALSLPSDTH
uniref:transposase n=1 Tax=Cellulomonas palmilytica TaxID=2608402 RepID=UPI001F21CCA0|nr:transposase [Cellulomonas palmilytica]